MASKAPVMSAGSRPSTTLAQVLGDDRRGRGGAVGPAQPGRVPGVGMDDDGGGGVPLQGAVGFGVGVGTV